MLISKILTTLSLILFFAFVIYLVWDATHAPTVPPSEDPDYYPTYLNDPLDPRD